MILNNATRCTCCKGCGKRKLGCHASCVDYQRYKKDANEKRNQAFKEKEFVFLSNKEYFHKKYA